MGSKFIKGLIGVALISLGVLSIIHWWGPLLILIKGSIGFALILAGLIAFALMAD